MHHTVVFQLTLSLNALSANYLREYQVCVLLVTIQFHISTTNYGGPSRHRFLPAVLTQSLFLFNFSHSKPNDLHYPLQQEVDWR